MTSDLIEAPEVKPARPTPSPADILQAVVEKGITAENVAVVDRLVGMCREVRAEEAKVAFNRALFQLRRAMPAVYADREVHTKSGELAFQYCSPQEIKEVLEPHLQQFGFVTVVGQTMDEGKVTATLTVLHKAGHSETRSYTCRVSPGTSLMSPTQCDAAATTAAERQAVIRFFGLRTRIRSEDDPRNVGTVITHDQADELHRRVEETNSNRAAFLKFCGVAPSDPPVYPDFLRIPSEKYALADEMLRRKEQHGK